MLTRIEGVGGRGSMYEVVDTMRQLTRALEELLVFLPSDFVWPTQVAVQPYSGYVEWGRDDARAPFGEPAVWLTANAEGVYMNSNFRPGWPNVDPLGFQARTAASWLQSLTQNWVWEATRFGPTVSTMLQRKPMSTGLDEDKEFNILMQVRAGSVNTSDASREEIDACVRAGLLEWTLPEELRGIQSAAYFAGLGDPVKPFESLPKLHPVTLTPLGWERIRSKLGFN